MLFQKSQEQKSVEVWAARNLTLEFYGAKPELLNGCWVGSSYLTSVNLAELIGIKPGECCQIEIRKVK